MPKSFPGWGVFISKIEYLAGVAVAQKEELQWFP